MSSDVPLAWTALLALLLLPAAAQGVASSSSTGSAGQNPADSETFWTETNTVIVALVGSFTAAVTMFLIGWAIKAKCFDPPAHVVREQELSAYAPRSIDAQTINHLSPPDAEQLHAVVGRGIPIPIPET